MTRASEELDRRVRVPDALRFRRRSVMGTPVDLVDHDAWSYAISRWLADETPGTAIGVNANLINLVRHDPTLAAIVHSAELTYADGKAVVWASRMLGWPVPERLATTDMIYSLCARLAERGSSVYLFGGEDGIAADAGAILASRYPGLVIAGTHHGFVSAEGEAALIADINASGAQVLLVGLGDPLQQMWVARNRGGLTATAVLTCGGLFNWITGRHPRPPEWVVSAGMEWAWRLALEPRRLWRRYLVGNPVFLANLARAMIRRDRGGDLLSPAVAGYRVQGLRESLDIPRQEAPDSAGVTTRHQEAQWS